MIVHLTELDVWLYLARDIVCALRLFGVRAFDREYRPKPAYEAIAAALR